MTTIAFLLKNFLYFHDLGKFFYYYENAKFHLPFNHIPFFGYCYSINFVRFLFKRNNSI